MRSWSTRHGRSIPRLASVCKSHGAAIVNEWPRIQAFFEPVRRLVAALGRRGAAAGDCLRELARLQHGGARPASARRIVVLHLAADAQRSGKRLGSLQSGLIRTGFSI